MGMVIFNLHLPYESNWCTPERKLHLNFEIVPYLLQVQAISVVYTCTWNPAMSFSEMVYKSPCKWRPLQLLYTDTIGIVFAHTQLTSFYLDKTP